MAQILTVLASAIGPLLLAECVAMTSSYAGIFYILSAIVATVAFLAWVVKVPELGGCDSN